MEINPITSVSEFLINHLRTEILTGGLAPGEKTNEYQLAEKLEVSRPILREVLRTLEGEGLVVSVPRKGSFVSQMNLQDFIELYEIREMIEGRVIDLLKRKKIREIPQVEEAIQNESNLKIPSQEAPVEEFLEFFETGLRFHSLLVGAAGNRRLSQFYKGIQHNLLRYHVIQGSKKLKVNSQINHKDLVDMLSRGNYKKAKDYLMEHIRSHAENIQTTLEASKQLN
jgi:DNA-binding GntR family transcriptional regulator